MPNANRNGLYIVVRDGLEAVVYIHLMQICKDPGLSVEITQTKFPELGFPDLMKVKFSSALTEMSVGAQMINDIVNNAVQQMTTIIYPGLPLDELPDIATSPMASLFEESEQLEKLSDLGAVWYPPSAIAPPSSIVSYDVTHEPPDWYLKETNTTREEIAESYVFVRSSGRFIHMERRELLFHELAEILWQYLVTYENAGSLDNLSALSREEKAVSAHHFAITKTNAFRMSIKDVFKFNEVLLRFLSDVVMTEKKALANGYKPL